MVFGILQTICTIEKIGTNELATFSSLIKVSHKAPVFLAAYISSMCSEWQMLSG